MLHGPRPGEKISVKKSWAGKRVWVSGHTGFKGSLLSHWLLEMGAEVAGYALAPATSPALYSVLALGDRMQSRIADIRNAVEVRRDLQEFRPDVVFHLAAQPLVRASFDEPAVTFETNVQGSVNVLEAIRHAPSVRACVMVTSDKCYENSGAGKAFRETDRLGGYDPYSASKAAAEVAIASYRKCFFQKAGSPRIASARAGNAIGGGDWSADRLMPDCIRSLVRGDPIVLRNPQAIRPWQHVLEPLTGYLQLAEELMTDSGELAATAWNFGPADGSQWPVRRIAELAVEKWGGGRLTEAPIGDTYREAEYLRLDSTQARLLLGWKSRWKTAEAVERTIMWHKAWLAGMDMIAFTTRMITEYLTTAPRAQLVGG
jgi:CDP-glucose 4,6-dehydratase